jgi:4-hydroxybenzoate polyprenyltransferase
MLHCKFFLQFHFLLILFVGSTHSFNSRLKRPWEKPYWERSSSSSILKPKRRKKNKDRALHYTDHRAPEETSKEDTENKANEQQQNDDLHNNGNHKYGDLDTEEILLPHLRTQQYHTPSDRNFNTSNTVQQKGGQHQGIVEQYNIMSSVASDSQPLPMTTKLSSSTKKSDVSEARIVDYVPELIAMTRPVNIPGVVMFHMIGTCLALRHYRSLGTATAISNTNYWQLLVSPHMMFTLLALLLTSSTSMLINDYYDYKLGNDSSKKGKPLQKIPLTVCKKALSYLYALALVCATMVPGVAGRVFVTGGLILTFLYTKHVKPRTWFKNALCASLISLSPLTSGVAAMSVLSSSATTILQGGLDWSLIRLVSMLFVGIMGREIAMDINDVPDDAVSFLHQSS